jgi:hypothetical protein
VQACRGVALLVALAGLRAGAAAADEPLALAGGRLRFAGEASFSLAPIDHGYFNFGDYDTNTLRLARLDLAAEARIAPPVSVLADVRVDNFDSVRLYALYLRVRPFAGRAVDLQAGLVPPVFGAYPRRRYASANPLPSVPLAYQYLTTVRPDAVPSRSEDLVRQRGEGWLVYFPVGSREPAPGLPLVNGERWDAGVQIRVAAGRAALAAALTQGSPSRPLVDDDNEGKQLSARLAVSPGPGLALGVSYATAEFLGRSVQQSFADRAQGTYRQHAAGLDAEWSGGPWIVRAEGVLARWRLPALDPTPVDAPLDAFAAYAEGRYKIAPGVYAAARIERLSFSRLRSDLGEATWDAPVTRTEIGAGWSPWRYATLKLAWQHNERDGGRVRRNDLLAGQVVVWY